MSAPPKAGKLSVRWGLAPRLMLLFCLLAVAPILLLGGLAIRNARRDVQSEVVRGNLALTRAIGHQLNETLQDARRALVVGASAWALRPELGEAVLRQLRAEFAIFSQLTILDRQGQPSAGGALSRGAGFSLELANTYGGYVSEVLDLEGRQQVLMVVQARGRTGELAGFLAAVVDLSFVQERLSEARLGRGAALLVVDGRGRPVAHTGRLPLANKGRNLRQSNPAVNQVLGSHSEGYLEFQDPAGERWVAVYRNIVGMNEFRGVRWGVLLLQPTADAYALARKASRDTVLVALAVLLLSLVVAAYLTRRITRPLARLVRQTELVAAENFEVVPDLPARRDEIGLLADSFAAMVHRLRQGRDKLYAQTELSENLVRAIPIGVISVDANGIIRSINPAQERLSELRAGSAQGRPLAEVFFEPTAATLSERSRRPARGLLEQLQLVLETGNTIDLTMDRVQTAFTPDVRLRYRVRMAPLRDRRGEVDGAVILQEDLSERARLEAQLVRSEKLSSVGVLAAGVAHEINNPLTTILGYAKLLLEGRDSEDPDRAALELVADEARRVQEIVRNMLDFSRQETGELVPVELTPLVERILSLVSPELRHRKVVVVRELAPELPLALADVRRIEQVFVNLVNNAAQAMPDGGTITVRTGSDAEQQGRVFASFSDTGSGIPADILPRIFDPFFTTKEPGQGTGLGLAVSHGIVSDHGGEIEVQSRPGEGSTFTVLLPEAET